MYIDSVNAINACSDNTKNHIHELVNDEAISATCTTEGVTEGKHCLLCDYKEGQEIIPALGHNIVIDDYIFPTCMESGLTEGSHCSRCNQIIISQK